MSNHLIALSATPCGAGKRGDYIESQPVCHCAVLAEGWDRPEASCLFPARPTKSFEFYRQIMGRVLRIAPHVDKKDALILDHSGAVFQHGFPDDEIHWTLDADRRAEKVTHSKRGEYLSPALTTCPECAAVRFESKPCPVCAWHAVFKPKSLYVSDGEVGLVEQNRAIAAAHWSSSEQLAFYPQLMGVAARRQYEPGRATHKFNERFGKYSPWDCNRADPWPQTGAVVARVRSRNIGFAKARAAR